MAGPCSIRFPEPLREQVAACAAVERRTFSGKVLLLVEAALEARRRTQAHAEQAFLDELVERLDAREVDEAAA